MASGDIGQGVLFAIRQPHHKQIAHAIAFRSVDDPLAVGRRLGMIMRRAVGGVRQSLGLAIERDSKQLDVVADFRRVEDRLAVDRPESEGEVAGGGGALPVDTG